MRRGEFAHGRDEFPWRRSERTKDVTVGFVLDFPSADMAEWLMDVRIASLRSAISA